MMLMEIWNRPLKLSLQGNKKIQHYPTTVAKLSPNKDYTYAKILKLPFFARTVHLAARRYNILIVNSGGCTSFPLKFCSIQFSRQLSALLGGGGGGGGAKNVHRVKCWLRPDLSYVSIKMNYSKSVEKYKCRRVHFSDEGW